MKQVVSMLLVISLCLALCACGNTQSSNDINESSSPTGKSNLVETQVSPKNDSQENYPKISDMDFYFVNGVSYGEPVALMGYTNNSEHTIVSLLIYYSVKADATEEELATFDVFVGRGDLEKEKIPTLTPYVYNHMVCDPTETVEGAKCTLFGYTDATDAAQCDVLVIDRAEISYLGSDGLVYTVAYAAANNGYSVMSGTEEPYSWSDGDIANAIPAPDTCYITVEYDEEDYYQFTAYDITYEQYNAYCEECKAEGFINDIESSKLSFWCTNNDGLTLNIKYYEYMNALIVYAELDEEYVATTAPAET